MGRFAGCFERRLSAAKSAKRFEVNHYEIYFNGLQPLRRIKRRYIRNRKLPTNKKAVLYNLTASRQ